MVRQWVSAIQEDTPNTHVVDISQSVKNLATGHYEIICYIGALSPTSIYQIRKVRRQLTPVIYIPCGQLNDRRANLLTRPFIKPMRNFDAAIISGKLEQKYLSSYNSLTLYELKNSIVSNQIAEKDFTSTFFKICQEVADQHTYEITKSIEQKIKGVANLNDTTQSLATAILYTQYLLQRNTLTISSLEALAQQMMTSEYDEDLFTNTLQQLHADKFTAGVEQVMIELSLLTEGFMPIPHKNNRSAREIRQAIQIYSAEKVKKST